MEVLIEAAPENIFQRARVCVMREGEKVRVGDKREGEIDRVSQGEGGESEISKSRDIESMRGERSLRLMKDWAAKEEWERCKSETGVTE